VLDELDWPEMPILGHSMGAIVSQLLAAVDPRVSHLYSMDALGPLASTTEQNLDRYQRLYDARNEQFPFRTYGSHQTLINTRLKGMFPLSQRAAEVMAQRAVGWAKDGWYHRYDRRLRQESLWRLSEPEVLAWLAKIPCPLDLLLFNAHQWSGYQSVFEPRKAAVQRLDVQVIEGSHHLHLESPELVAKWLEDRLN
jgi:pimeloyl-ACP methyl ester carboxylesterase